MNLKEIIDSDALDLLTHVGLLAAAAGMTGESDQLYEGLCAAYPDSADMRSLHAAALVTSGRLADAAALLAKAMSKYPNHASLLALMAAVRHELGDASWRELARQVRAEGDDDNAYRLAKNLLRNDVSGNELSTNVFALSAAVRV